MFVFSLMGCKETLHFSVFVLLSQIQRALRQCRNPQIQAGQGRRIDLQIAIVLVLFFGWLILSMNARESRGVRLLLLGLLGLTVWVTEFP